MFCAKPPPALGDGLVAAVRPPHVDAREPELAAPRPIVAFADGPRLRSRTTQAAASAPTVAATSVVWKRLALARGSRPSSEVASHAHGATHESEAAPTAS